MPRKRAAGGWRTMSGVIEAVNWQENADELHALYKAERNVEARKRLLALWLVRRGQSVGDAAKTAGVGRGSPAWGWGGGGRGWGAPGRPAGGEGRRLPGGSPGTGRAASRRCSLG